MKFTIKYNKATHTITLPFNIRIMSISPEEVIVLLNKVCLKGLALALLIEGNALSSKYPNVAEEYYKASARLMVEDSNCSVGINFTASNIISALS